MQIADYFQNPGLEDNFAIGLHTEFQPLEGHDIGQFSGLDSKKQTNEDMKEAKEYQLIP